MEKHYANAISFGRILYLCDDPELIQTQLQVITAGNVDMEHLRDDVSTDEITPVSILSYYDKELGRFAYTGLKVAGAFPIGNQDLASSDVEVVVAGQRYGKGSSREHSPAAEMYAGIRLVIAKSFERIYRQNADNIGLLTSTDFGLIDRIERGEAISLDELVADRDELAATIIKSGGLLRFGQHHMRNMEPRRTPPAHRPLTLFEKIIGRHQLIMSPCDDEPGPGQGAFVRADWRFIHEYYTGMCEHMLNTTYGKPLSLFDPDSILIFEDHTSYMHVSPAHVRAGLIPNMVAMRDAQRTFAGAYGLRMHRTLTDEEAMLDDGGNVAGISHAMMAEHYALPGQVVVGTDSHTPHSGALGCVAFGVGTTDMANAFMTGAVRMTMPQSLLIDLQGAVPAGVTAKDIVLKLLAQPSIRGGAGVGKAFEFTGPVVADLSIDERATLTNMVAELGGFSGIVAPDEKTVDFIRARREEEFCIEPWMHSDPGAHYADAITIDCSRLSPIVARPGDPGNGLPLADLKTRVMIDIAYGGSCTGGKQGDFDLYHEVLYWALQRNMALPANVKLYLQYGTTAVRDYCVAKGYDSTFRKMGASLLQPSCGACANCGPGVSVDAAQVTVSSINRNFPGRSGPGQVWLASPPTVAASALAGELISFEDLKRRSV
ncbi:3-isopropylmalate dehydratase [Pollutimonas subterranea]|uniref:3-isopropylmalate dehydratase n=1 Tax=Pollutimonas subterranea TaxID=2045210 RepID=A0A2N4U7I7_9BURK|nr:aconitase family protein [Pollutimonas subterranea]PLC50982.1 3-isopropylmalate dehydratase [Pollutimonas subterranea]